MAKAGLNGTVLKGYRRSIGSGDRAAIGQYYNYLESQGIPYGALAADIAQEHNFMGQFSNEYLRSYISKQYPNHDAGAIRELRDKIMIDLAISDINARIIDLDSGRDGAINYRDIATYHWQVLREFGLPKNAWLGSLYEDFLGTGSWMNGYDPAIYVSLGDYLALHNSIDTGKYSENGIYAHEAFLDLIEHGFQKDSFWEILLADPSGFLTSAFHAMYDWPGSPYEELFYAAKEAFKDLQEKFGKAFDGVMGFFIPNRVSDSATDAGTGFARGITAMDPVILDLNGSGVAYTALGASNIYFDTDGDGFAERTEWTDGVDGFLVRDTNGDGQISTISEMFGDDGGTSAYAKLAALDGNGDGRIDSGDATFPSFAIFQDANLNGRVDDGELKSLSQWNIASISTNHSGDTISGGHAVAGTSTFSYGDGRTGIAVNALLAADQIDSWYVGPSADALILDEDVYALPQSRGYGTIPSLAYAMSQDDALKNMVRGFVNINPATQMREVYDRIEAITLKWAGVDQLDPHGRGNYVDARHLAVLEKINDQSFVSREGSANPTYAGARPLGYGYSQFQDELLIRLLAQGPLRNVFLSASYNVVTDRMEFHGAFANVIERATKFAPLRNSLHYTTYWDEIARVVTAYHDEFEVSANEARAAVDAAAGFKTMVVTVLGSPDDDYLAADAQGSPPWVGSQDVLYGGLGNDVLVGWNDSDTYLFGRAPGDDTINERISHVSTRTQDTIAFRENITSGDIRFGKHGQWDLVIEVPSAQMTITVDGYFHSRGYFRVEHIEFSDGNVWHADVLYGAASAVAAAPLQGAETADTVLGGEARDAISLLAGDDVAFGYSGQDTLFGGHGNDALYGNQDGDDLYGNLGADTLFGGQGADIAFGGQDSDTVYGNLGGDLLYGNLGSDALFGGQGIDLLFGGQGDDSVYGNRDADILYGNLGADVLVGGAGADTLTGGAGADAFRIDAPGEGGDVIADFAPGEDVIAISSPNFGGVPAGRLAAGRFALDNPLDADDWFVFNTQTGALSFDADGNGAGAAVLLATLNVRTLNNTDIFVIAP